MRERLDRAHVGEVGAGAAAERPARGGEHERVNGVRRLPVEELKRGRVLGVDREQAPSPAPPGGHRQVAPRDEALLVGERQVDAVLQGPEGCRQSGEADDGVEDDVRLGAVEQLRQVTADLGERGQAVDRGRTRRGRHELELGVVRDDLERLAPDRPRGAQEGDALHRRQCRDGARQVWVSARTAK